MPGGARPRRRDPPARPRQRLHAAPDRRPARAAGLQPRVADARPGRADRDPARADRRDRRARDRRHDQHRHPRAATRGASTTCALGAGYENGEVPPGVSWTRNDTAGALTYNDLGSTRSTTDRDEQQHDDDGRRPRRRQVTLEQSRRPAPARTGGGLHADGAAAMAAARAATDSVTLMPILFANRSDIAPRRHARRSRPGAVAAALRHRPTTTARTGTSLARLNAQWTPALRRGARRDRRATSARRSRRRTLRTELTNGSASAHARGRRARVARRDGRPRAASSSPRRSSEHSLLGGVEAESNAASTRDELQNGLPILTDFGDNLSASTLRLAAYAQDEWSARRALGGARRAALGGHPHARHRRRRPARRGNRSSVWTPLLHAVWKPDPKSRDQVRFSLTRSYRSPSLANLIARPSDQHALPVPGPNTRRSPTAPATRTSSPSSRPASTSPSSATSPGGGVLSANVFRRSISNLIRSVDDARDRARTPGAALRVAARRTSATR